MEDYFQLNDGLEVYKDTFNLTSQFIAIMDNHMSIKLANKAMLDLIHSDSVNIYDTPYWELPLWSHSIELQNRIMFSVELIYLGEEVTFDAIYYDDDNNKKYIEVTMKAIYDENDDISAIVAMGYDITGSKRAEKNLHKMQQQLAMFFEMGVDGFYISDIGEPIEIKGISYDEVFEKVMNEEKMSLYNSSVCDILEMNVDNVSMRSIFLGNALKVSEKILKNYWIEMLEKGYTRFLTNLISKHDQKKYIEFTVMAIVENGRYKGCYGTLKDITVAKNAEEHLFMLANFDYLTGVCNRRYFIDSINQILSSESNDSICMAMFDLDHFKSINDTYGHDAGDIALRSVSGMINTVILMDGLFARMGGEEFAALIYKDLEESEKLIQKVLSAIRELEIIIDTGKIIKITLSAGLTLVKKGEAYDEFFKRADKALYEAKKTGRDRYVIK